MSRPEVCRTREGSGGHPRRRVTTERAGSLALGAEASLGATSVRPNPSAGRGSQRFGRRCRSDRRSRRDRSGRLSRRPVPLVQVRQVDIPVVEIVQSGAGLWVRVGGTLTQSRIRLTVIQRAGKGRGTRRGGGGPSQPRDSLSRSSVRPALQCRAIARGCGSWSCSGLPGRALRGRLSAGRGGRPQ